MAEPPPDRTPAPGALALVPGLESGAAPLRLERLHGGSVNDSWRVETPAGRFVLRLDGAEWRRPGVNRARERVLHAAAAQAGLAPALIAQSVAAGALVSTYVDGHDWSEADFAVPAQLERLGERLQRLHSLPVPPGLSQFDPQSCARDYLRRLAPGVGARAGAAAVVDRVGEAAATVAGAAASACIIHGDLAPGNLREGACLWLLDWEYAQLAHPDYDVACLLAYHPAARPHQARLLGAAGLAGNLEALGAAVYVYEALTWLWRLARGEAALPPEGAR
ncbi:MAG TPA: phosphotransferase [Steroidobacteraceae bacterium]|nr:phosphotransferase [Steroidobacteraceae bacterium]